MKTIIFVSLLAISTVSIAFGSRMIESQSTLKSLKTLNLEALTKGENPGVEIKTTTEYDTPTEVDYDEIGKKYIHSHYHVTKTDCSGSGKIECTEGEDYEHIIDRIVSENNN